MSRWSGIRQNRASLLSLTIYYVKVIVVCVCIAKEGAMRMTISAYADDSIHIVIFLAAYYRLRHSEVLGLKWSAVDFEHNLIKQYICLC